MKAPAVDCFRCRRKGHCSDEPDLCREAFFAVGQGKSAPECQHVEPRWWHGVEGVSCQV